MYSVIKNNVLIFLLIAIVACDEPTPIQINNTEEEFELSIVNNDPSTYVITGYDSTGIIEETPLGVSIISISGIKNTIGRTTLYKGYGQAVFFDTTKPILNVSERLIGYKALKYGTVKFNDKTARILPYYLSFREKNIIKDTLAGVRHIITYQTVFNHQNHDFPYNTNVNLEITDDQGNTNLLNSRLPEEIVGNVELIGDNIRNDQKIIISWNVLNSSDNYDDGKLSEEIILGGVTQTRDELIPLFRVSNFSFNRFEIKKSLVSDIIESGKFEYLVFTFIRKIRKSTSTNRVGEIYFASQSIHNIWIKI